MFLSYCSIAVLLSLSHTLLASPVINLSPFNGAPAIKERAAIDDLKECKCGAGNIVVSASDSIQCVAIMVPRA